MAKNYHKIGNQQGKPAYRTPSSFKFRQSVQKREINAKNNTGKWQAHRREIG